MFRWLGTRDLRSSMSPRLERTSWWVTSSWGAQRKSGDVLDRDMPSNFLPTSGYQKIGSCAYQHRGEGFICYSFQGQFGRRKMAHSTSQVFTLAADLSSLIYDLC